MAAMTKKTQAMTDYDKETARLGRYLGRLTTLKPWPGGSTVAAKPILSLRMYSMLRRIDDAMIGTPDYMGLAYWHAHEYKHTMREATPAQRKRAHDAILAAGLPLGGVSDDHQRIIDKHVSLRRLAA